MLDINNLKYRKEPQKYTQMIVKNETSNVVNSEKTKLFDYYVCDYCSDKIRLDIKKTERSGGIAIIPHSLTKCGELRLALCNKCLIPAIEDIERVTNK